MWPRMIALSLVLTGWLVGPSAADTMQARCKVNRTIDMSVSPNKVEVQSDYIRSDARYDWVFAYDLELGRLCKVAPEGICMLTSEDFAAAADGNLKGVTKAFSSEKTGNLILSPASGHWVYQTGLTQTMGTAGDCVFSPAEPQQIALISRDPSRDIDVLCAGRLNVEATILQSIGNGTSGGEFYRKEQLDQAQNVMMVANALLDRTNNRGYGRDESLLAAVTESEAYAQRSDAQRQSDMSECEAHLAALNR